MKTEQPTPPKGMRILAAEELTKPLPMDAMCISKTSPDNIWHDSVSQGQVVSEYKAEHFHYATATPPPTDWRKLVEELVQKSDYILHSYVVQTRALTSHPCPENLVECRELNNALTRAKAALEVQP